jgi:sugar transferase (PEP-CTERM/EpsH1 system associated)
MARFALEPPLRQIPFVLDMVDVDSAKWAALSGINWPPFSWVYAREARLLARFEAVAARHARMTFVVTERERETLSAIAPDARVEIVPNGVDATNFQPHGDPATDEVVVFCGVMNYAPNVDGVVWLAREVWPLVRARKPGARLEIVGSDPTNAVKALADERSEISVTGRVPDVRQHLWRAAIAVAPLQTARGVQNKVLEAVAAGLPTVVTPLVAQGLPSEIIGACIIADGPAAFCDAIVTLLNLPPSERRRRALLADLTGLSWDRRLQPLHQLLTAAAGG